MNYPLRNTGVVKFVPAGLSDALEGDEVPGACAVLQNLIPDPSTKNVWICRPASVSLTTFGSFTTPGFISVFKVIGSWVYGMIATGRNAGFDEPFAYNIVTNTFATIANVLSSNVPTSPSTSGDWVPPTMDLVGINLIVTHPGFSAPNYFGWIDISDPTAPRWHAGNLYVTGSITLLGAITGGSSYTNGTYPNVAMTTSSGPGSGARADIVVSGGAVSSVKLDVPGSAYTTASVLSASAASIGGTGSGFTIPVAAVQTAGLISFSTAPAWVRQFNQRAYFGVNPSVGNPSTVFTDTLGLGCTSANQALTFGNNYPLVGACPLGLSNQLGGIIQALMIFQDDANIVQITGDSATSNLSVNTLNISIGTVAPRTLVGTPFGIFFLAPDGIRVIDFDARISDPIGASGTGVTIPFLNAVFPTRINAASNGPIYRISLQNGGIAQTPWQEYWYDMVRKVWSGPHTFPSSMIDDYNGNFIIAPQGVTASLFESMTTQTSSSVFTENGNAMNWTFQSAMLPDNGQMSRNDLVEMRVMASVQPTGGSFNIIVQDENGNPISQVTRTVASTSPSLWDSATWDSSLWDSGAALGLYPFRIDFPSPVVYTRAAIHINGTCAAGARLAEITMRTRPLPYLDDLLAP